MSGAQSKSTMETRVQHNWSTSRMSENSCLKDIWYWYFLYDIVISFSDKPLKVQPEHNWNEGITHLEQRHVQNVCTLLYSWPVPYTKSISFYGINIALLKIDINSATMITHVKSYTSKQHMIILYNTSGNRLTWRMPHCTMAI